MRIMIIDDVQMNVYLLSRAARPFGEVSTHTEPISALEAIRDALQRENPFDLLLLDISMPSMDGLEFLRRLRTLEKEAGIEDGGTRVVMVTADGDRKTVAEAIRRGAQGYLLKPVQEVKVQAEIRRLFPETEDGTPEELAS